MIEMFREAWKYVKQVGYWNAAVEFVKILVFVLLLMFVVCGLALKMVY